ncbi:hypothetical protein BCR43DRAFT_513657 [Syncephalastrum racemosum]|uniref:AAA+ ATPase domain-containing protein n=1 Tax=Syncephalastrum racemosum TaxID=13706 RepID=A0A1X2HFI9_SYNRA|nr:hypothetical protein BCR43DRAFT_513657 [Syncephalastrum racemosum]
MSAHTHVLEIDADGPTKIRVKKDHTSLNDKRSGKEYPKRTGRPKQQHQKSQEWTQPSPNRLSETQPINPQKRTRQRTGPQTQAPDIGTDTVYEADAEYPAQQNIPYSGGGAYNSAASGDPFVQTQVSDEGSSKKNKCSDMKPDTSDKGPSQGNKKQANTSNRRAKQNATQIADKPTSREKEPAPRFEKQEPVSNPVKQYEARPDSEADNRGSETMPTEKPQKSSASRKKDITRPKAAKPTSGTRTAKMKTSDVCSREEEALSSIGATRASPVKAQKDSKKDANILPAESQISSADLPMEGNADTYNQIDPMESITLPQAPENISYDSNGEKSANGNVPGSSHSQHCTSTNAKHNDNPEMEVASDTPPAGVRSDIISSKQHEQQTKEDIVNGSGPRDLERNSLQATSKQDGADVALPPTEEGMDDKTKSSNNTKRKKVASKNENPFLVKTTASVVAERSKVPLKERTWPERYRPRTLQDIVGNKKLIRNMKLWLTSWKRSLQDDNIQLTKTEKEIFNYRAILISGPPGIGKTSAVHLLAKETNFEMLELNASDARSKGVLESKLSEMFDNRTMTEFYTRAQERKKRVLLLMDEVDGMQGANDRGGAATLAKLIEKTKIPVICICNNPKSKVVKPLKAVCFAVQFTRSKSESMAPRLSSIGSHEKIRIASQAIEELVRGTKSDIRQILNLLTTFKLGDNSGPLGPQAAKELILKHGKDIRRSMFDIPTALLDNRHWQLTNLNTKCNVYFDNDTMAPMMIHENYVRYTPGRTPKGVSTEIGELQCIADAAESIADGDILEAALHGPQHDYGLAQAHSMLSCVRPAYFMHGTNKMKHEHHNYPLHLANMRREAKSKRVLRDLRDTTLHNAIKRRHPLPLLTNRDDIRQDNVPALNGLISHYFQDESTHQEVLDIMDAYGLDKAHLDSLEHLTIGEKDIFGPRGAATTRTKMAFGRRYARLSKDSNVKDIKKYVYRNDALEQGDQDTIDWYDDDDNDFDDENMEDFMEGLADVDEQQLFF